MAGDAQRQMDTIFRAGSNRLRGQKLQYATNHGLPSLYAEMSEMLIDVTRMMNTDLLTACLDRSRMDTRLNPFCSLRAKPFIADTLLKDAVYGAREMSHDESTAWKLAQLIALPYRHELASDDEVLACRRKIMVALRTFPIPVGDVTKCVTEIVKKCAAISPADKVVSDTLALVIPDYITGTEIHVNKYQFYRLFGHVFPQTFLIQQTSKNIWIALSSLNDQEVAIDIADWDGSIDDEQYKLLWAQFSDDQILGLYDMLGEVNKVSAQAWSMAALFVSIATIAKGVFSELWVNRRVAQVNTNPSQYDIKPLIKPNVLEYFYTMINRTGITEDRIIEIIHASATLMEGQNFPSLTWMLEQAASVGITHGLTIGLVCQKMPYWDIDVFLDAGMPLSDATNFLQLALKVIRSPYSTVYNIPVPVAKYANLAYIALYTAKVLMKETTLADYAGDAKNSCIMHTPLMNALAKMYFDVHKDLEIQNITTLALLQSRVKVDEGQIMQFADSIYAVEKGVRDKYSASELIDMITRYAEVLLNNANTDQFGHNYADTVPAPVGLTEYERVVDAAIMQDDGEDENAERTRRQLMRQRRQ